MQDLIERLEKATGPDRNLDRETLRFISGRVVRDETFIYGAKHGTREIETAYPYKFSCWFAPRYTQSIDAALTLAPDRWSWRVSAPEPRNWGLVVLARSYPTNESFSVEARTPAIALCIAALRARAAPTSLTQKHPT